MPPSTDASAWLEVPVDDLLRELWHWPGQSEFLELYAAKPALQAMSDLVAAEPEEIGGYLLGQHFLLGDAAGGQRHGVIILNFFKVERGEGDEFRFGASSRAGDMDAIREVPVLGGLEVVGWFHSHHDRGAFLSPSVDQPIHRRSFPEPFQVAYVLDLERRQAGFFIWEGEELKGSINQCLAVFDPRTLAVKQSRSGRRLNPLGQDKRKKTTGSPKASTKVSRQEVSHDLTYAALILLAGLVAFFFAYRNRPIAAWSVPGSQVLQWQSAGARAAYYAIYRTAGQRVDPVADRPFGMLDARASHSLDIDQAELARPSQADRGKLLYYTVAAYDSRSRPFRWSTPVAMVLPSDAMPPGPAVALTLSGNGTRAVLRISGCQGPGILGCWLLREGPLTTDDILPLAGGKPITSKSSYTWVDRVPAAGAYRYLVMLQDWAGNFGPVWSSPAVALARSR
ncbi:MAG: hypothetical protein KGR26_04725 [Cyanobacteria bacterium REEB65]|nr:hypothetical protein [Cyanobacteria bacterium REEB65]